ncbi:hypothetical protein PFJ87_08g00620 [Encephalitozoon hellem]|uniref:Uncharacterized protein n=1 Tax=Encephalitozoon hellem TaxID=27973 RepID=A0ABY8CNS6_ENCHE|nr:hypothetical protein PFJ87_08g00620 [Encephalitozoon hellem]
MDKVDRNLLKSILNSDTIFALLAAVALILEALRNFVTRASNIATTGMQGALALSCLMFFWNTADSITRRITSERFSMDGGFGNPAVIVSLIEIIMVLVSIKMLFFYPFSGKEVPYSYANFGLLGAIFLPYIFSECLRLLISYKKNTRRDKMVLSVIIVGCLTMMALSFMEYSKDKNYIGAGLFGIGLLMLAVRLGFMHEEEAEELFNEGEDEDSKMWDYVAICATLVLVSIILAWSHKILFTNQNASFLEVLKSLTFLGKEAPPQKKDES